MTRGDISHVPWDIRSAEWEIGTNEVLDAAQISPTGDPVGAYSIDLTECGTIDRFALEVLAVTGTALLLGLAGLARWAR